MSERPHIVSGRCQMNYKIVSNGVNKVSDSAMKVSDGDIL